jgi:hypothetical protein
MDSDEGMSPGEWAASLGLLLLLLLFTALS